MEYVIIIAGTVALYTLFALWWSRRERLREYTHIADIAGMRMIRVRPDAEGRAIMVKEKDK